MGEKLQGDFPEKIALARELMTKDGQPGEFVRLEGDDRLLVRDDFPGYWVIWIDGDPIDTICPSAFRSASQLIGYLSSYANGDITHNERTPGRGYQ